MCLYDADIIVLKDKVSKECALKFVKENDLKRQQWYNGIMNKTRKSFFFAAVKSIKVYSIKCIAKHNCNVILNQSSYHHQSLHFPYTLSCTHSQKLHSLIILF